MQNTNTDNRIFDRKGTRKTKILAVSVFALLISFILFAQSIYSQVDTAPASRPAPKPRPTVTPSIPSQTTPRIPETRIEGIPPKPQIWKPQKRRITNESGFPAEK